MASLARKNYANRRRLRIYSNKRYTFAFGMKFGAKHIKGYIFDLDGVIVDTRPYHLAAWKRLADQLGVAIDAEHNEILRGLSRMQSLEKILEWGGLYVTEAEKLHWADVKNNWYIDLISGMTPNEVLPGVRDFVAAARQEGIKTAVVSSSKNAKKVLRSVDLEELFDAVVDGTVTKKSKPAPDCFLMAAELLALQPSECVVFEDAPIGVDAARKGGFFTVGVGLHRALCAADFSTEGFVGLDPLFVNELNFIHTESE